MISTRLFSTRLLLGGLAATLLAATASADFEARASHDKPADVRFEFTTEDDTGNSTCFHRGNGAFKQIGQAFTLTAPRFSMTAVSVRIWEAAPETRGKRFSVKLYRLKSPNIAPDPVHDLVFSESGALPLQIDPRQYLTFQLEAAQTLEEGASYLLLFGFEEPTSAGNEVKALGLERTNGPGPFGRLWVYNGENFLADRKTLLFSLHGTEAP